MNDRPDWPCELLADAQSRIRTRRDANLAQLRQLEGRHAGSLEALAAMREHHAAATGANAEDDGTGAGLAAACKRLHELAVASHTEVIAQNGALRENGQLIDALGSLIERGKAAAVKAAEREELRERPRPLVVAESPAPTPGRMPDADDQPSPAAPAPASPPDPMRDLLGMTVGKAISLEERRVGRGGDPA